MLIAKRGRPQIRNSMADEVLFDVLRSGLKIVFCGTAASKHSAQKRAYYAGPGNQFWPVLHRVGLTSYQIPYSQFEDILNFGYGLTDLAKYVSGNDDELRSTDFDVKKFRQKILYYAPDMVAFTSKQAAKLFFKQSNVNYGLQSVTIEETQLYVLPSPSGAARRYWDESYWQALAMQV